MARIVEFEGRRIEVPDDATDEEVSEILSAQPQSAPPAAAEQPVAAAAAPAAPRTMTDAIMDGADYVDDTAAVGLREGRRGFSQMLGLPVDLVNAGLGLVGVPTSDTPFLGSESIDQFLGLPSEAAAAITGKPAEVEPQDAFQRVVGRAGKEIGAAGAALAGPLGVAARTGVEGARQMGPLARMFVEPAAVAPARLVGREAAYATGAGVGAGVANEAAGNEQNGDNFWSDFLGALGGAGLTAAGTQLVGGLKNAVGAVRGKPNYFDDVAGQEVADRIINNSTELGEQFATTGRVDTAPLANRLRRPAPIEEAVPGYVANIGDRSQDPLLMTAVQNQDMLSPGAANVRRTGNDAAITQRMADVAPAGDPAQLRAAVSSNRDAQIAEAIDAEEMARLIFGEAEQAVQPGMRDATARGSSLRSGLQDKYDDVQEYVRSLFEPLNDSGVEVPIGPLAERFGATTDSLPLNDRSRFLPSEANLPDRLTPLDAEGAPVPDATVPLREVTSARSGLTDDIRQQRAGGQKNAARVTSKFRDQIDEFTDEVVPPEIREQYETARAARRDQGDRFERPGTGIAETLRPREGGGYRLDDSAVAGKFAQPDQGRITDTRALLREAGDDPRVRGALADEILSDVQSRGLINKPQALEKYMGERNILLGEFPELRDSLTRARAAGEYRSGVEAASASTQKRLTTPGRSAEANFLQFGDEATVDAVRNLISGPQPRQAAKELIEAAGNTPEARLNARSALWEAVKTKKFSAPGATGGERWDAKKLKAFFDDPKTAAVADELWSDAPEELADIKNLFAALAGAEGSVRTRAPNSSGTAQALSGKFDAALSASSVASRARSVSRGVLSPTIAVVDIASTWLRRRSAQVQSRAIDTLASAAMNNPGLAADLLDAFNPADFAAKRAMISQKYGVRATQVLNLLDEMQDEDDVMEAVTGQDEPGVVSRRPLEITVGRPRDGG